jgi:hypothetical protein
LLRNWEKCCRKLSLTKLALNFGLEIAIESGKLTTLIVKGSSKANLEITLEWGNK